MKRPKDTVLARVRREEWERVQYHAWQMTDQKEKGDLEWAEYHKEKGRAAKRAWLWAVEEQERRRNA